MRKIGLVVFVFFCGWQVCAQRVEVIKFDRLQNIIDAKAEKIQVINFWATWCAPCVKELPLFEKLNADKKDVKVTLINLDFADKEKKVESCVLKNKNKKKIIKGD
jgi:thiol-disulfide isomerase/thioredoxin